MESAILKKISGYKDYVIELQKGLVGIPAVDPGSDGTGELEKAKWLEKELRKLKFDKIERFDAPDKRAKGGVRPNIVARYRGTGKTSSVTPTFWIMSHLDVVPPGERKLWKTDPFKLHIEGNKLYGRGTEDNHQGLVASILCLRGMMDAGYRAPFDIALLFAADEETGSDYGAIYLTKKHPGLFGKKDVFLVPDGGSPDASMVEIAEKSILWLKITTRGKQCHASTPAQGKNSFRAASELVVRLGDLHKKFNKIDKLFDPPISTFEPTKKEANVPNINTIPGDDVFYLDSRILPDYSLKALKAEVRKHADAIEKKHGVSISLETVQEGEAAPPTPKDADIVKAVIASIKEVYPGAKPKAMGIGGGTVAAVFRHLNLPAVVYSKQDETAHMPNEFCLLDNLIGDAKVFALAAMKMVPAFQRFSKDSKTDF